MIVGEAGVGDQSIQERARRNQQRSGHEAMAASKRQR
jgi:hypothetical protein